MSKLIHVAAAVITRPDGSFLLGQRAPDTFYPGYWEFPGGKLEAGETPHQALVRELAEELDITVDEAWPWLVREHRYEHAHVHLHFFYVPAWHGELRARVHSALAWQQPDGVTAAPMLPANAPILKALRLPRRMGITRAAATGSAAQLAALDRALAGGLRMVQIREARLPEAEREAFAREAVARCREHAALVLINGDVELARRCAADGIHVPAAQLATLQRRPDFEWVGAACHTRVELERAAALDLDYALLGAVQPTATHPEREALGWEGFSRLAGGLALPVLALGGLSRTDLDSARAAGAHGIAAIRDAWTD